jgi:histidinol-phosphate phosphatase family protein
VRTTAHPGGHPAVFVDRDGTINRDVPYCSRPEDFCLLPGAAAGIRLLNDAGLVVVVVTNQSGIARGYFNEVALAEIHRRMRDLLGAHGAKVDAVYHCPHHPEAGCACRKPGTLLTLQAAQDLGLDLAASYVVGDSTSDIKMGRQLGCMTVRICQDGPGPQIAPDFVAGDLHDAARWIVARYLARRGETTDAPAPRYWR